MQCPNCALYHPSRYQNCVSCGTKLVADAQLIQQAAAQAVQQQPATTSGAGDQPNPERKRRGMPMSIGVGIAGFILCASAGGTFFFLTKPPENERLLQEGQKQLQLGQYAFAVKTLTEATKVRPNDAKALLALARAYVGVDQVDKAWACITQAQQLGTGVVAEPELASDLASYYRQRNQYQKAVELLRPLALADVKGKKAELADLDASWGDECIRSGDFRQAMRCWEEVKELHDGSRFVEAESRLATIYQKIADQMLSKGDDEEALKFFTKLNVQAPTATSFERTAEIYDRQGKVELAIDQMRRAAKLSGDNSLISHKLSALMVKRGKELLDSGEADSGYGYLQQAQSMDPHLKAPTATVRNMRFEVDGQGGSVHISGEVWNPGQEMLNSLTLRAELFDKKTSRVLWSKDQRVIDEFVPPLPSRDSRGFDLVALAPFDPATSELKIYLNGSLYKSYPLGKGKPRPATTTAATPSDATNHNGSAFTLRPRLAPVAPPTKGVGGFLSSPTNESGPEGPQPAPNTVTSDTTAPPVAPATAPSHSAEEKTLRDLD